jgi:hypothetical protein
MNSDEALEVLRRLCPPGTTIYTILRHVSRTGMMRCISAFVIHGGEPYMLDWLIDDAGILRMSDKHGGLVVHGCGMDMGYQLVQVLGRSLYPDGEGGYALWHRWL